MSISGSDKFALSDNKRDIVTTAAALNNGIPEPL